MMSHFVAKKDLKKRRSGSGGSGGRYGADLLSEVVEKLKRHPDYKDKTVEELRQKAKQLADVDELHADFSHLTGDAFEQNCEDIADEERVGFTHSLEVQQAQCRAIRRLQPIPVKLFLFELRNPTSRFFSRFSQLFAFKYGALHAAIQIGDVVLQWGTSSLVIPERYNPEAAVFQTDFGAVTTVAQVAAEMQPEMVSAVTRMDYNHQVKLQYDLAVGMEEMLEKVKTVVVRYNRKFYYNVMYRNCQTFVDDVMGEIGVVNPPQRLTGKLKEYFKQLTTKKSVKSDLPTHQALDEYVRKLDLSTLSQHDKEYLLCLYLQFHLEAMKTDKDPSEGCGVEGCLMDEVEAGLDEMILEKVQ